MRNTSTTRVIRWIDIAIYSALVVLTIAVWCLAVIGAAHLMGAA